MNKRNWWNQPMTRKNWSFVYAICFAVTLLYLGGMYIWYRWADLKESLNTMKRAMNRGFRKDSEFDED